MDPMANMAPPIQWELIHSLDSEGDPMAGLDAALGGAMDQLWTKALVGCPDTGAPPDAGAEMPADAPDTAPEPAAGPTSR